MDSTGISFTALFTGQVWYEEGLSARFFTSPKGRWLYQAAQPIEKVSRALLGTNVHDMLVERHTIMDQRLDQLIKEEGVTQVLEIACGFSPRGYAVSRQYPGIKYVEADLPHMAERKRALLNQHQGFGPDHHVVACDVFADGAPLGLDHIMSNVLDPTRPTVVITEGLVNYFRLSDISQVWSRIAQLGKTFPKAWYLTDMVPQPKRPWRPLISASTRALSLATRAHVSLHFQNRQQIEAGMTQCGFSAVTVHHPNQYRDQLPIPTSGHTPKRSLVRVVECEI